MAIAPSQPTKAARLYLTEAEILRLMTMAHSSRHGKRDKAMIWTGFRHGLRCGELLHLKWSQFDFSGRQLHIHRLKQGTPAIHPLEEKEIRLIKALRGKGEGEYVFTTDQGGPLSARAFRKIMAVLGLRAGLPPPTHPHQLRHACGFALAARGVDLRAIQVYLGHRSITHTIRYTELSPDRFKTIWD